MNEFEYKILVENENPKLATIEKTGIKANFTLLQVEEHEAYLVKELGKAKTIRDAYEAQTMLLENRHPEFKDFAMENWNSIKAYCDKKMQLIEYNESIDKIEKQIEAYKVETAHIISSLGLVIKEEVAEPNPETVPETPNVEANEETVPAGTQG